MTIWYKQGVYGDLNNEAMKCLGRIHDHYGKDLMVTAIRDGNHMAGSLHYNGNAFDFRLKAYMTKPDLKKICGKGNAFDFRLKAYMTKPDLKKICGKDFDVVIHSTHVHVEYDPKEG
jgi:hypothetical protein